jgi:polysaccharide export outer membrane protein
MSRLGNSIMLAGAVILSLVLSACSTTSAYPPAPTVPAKGADWNYLIGPGDTVQVFVWRNPDVSGSFPVRPDGKMTMNLVEDMPASGKTPSQLARDIEKSLSKYIQDPIVTVIVAGGVGPYSQQVRVVGEAAKPQALNYREHMSLIDLMIAVGGLTDYADGNKAYILRNENGKKVPLGVRLDDLIRGGDYSANVEMLPGDILVIPENLF